MLPVPIALSKSVSAKPTRARIGAQDVVVWRARDGTPLALHDACPHRGAPLSRGTVDDACVACPYHGWKLDGASGRVLDMPADPRDDGKKHRGRATKIELSEANGLVWAVGRGEIEPTTRLVPELNDDSFAVVQDVMTFEAPLRAVVDNLTDVAHVAWLHTDTFGNKENPEIEFKNIDANPARHGGVAARFNMQNKPVRGWAFAKVPKVAVEVDAIPPNSCRIAFDLGAGVSFATYAIAAPVGPMRTDVYFFLARRYVGVGRELFHSAIADGPALAAMRAVLEQDREMVESLAEIEKEMHAPSDALQLAFRNKSLNKCVGN